MGRKGNTAITPAQRDARRENSAKARAAKEKSEAKRRAEAAALLDRDGTPPLAVSQARREAARAGLAELELEQRKGSLVTVEESRQVMTDKFSAVRTRLLGLPAKIKQRLPHVAVEDVRVIDEIVRAALEVLADDGDAE